MIRHRRFEPAVLTHTSGDNFSGTLPVSLVVFRRDAQGSVSGFEAGNGRARAESYLRRSIVSAARIFLSHYIAGSILVNGDT